MYKNGVIESSYEMAYLEKMPTMYGWLSWLYEVGVLCALVIS